MSYVIYEKESTLFVRIFRNGYWQEADYKTEGAAKSAFNRLVMKGKAGHATHAIAERSHFHKHIEKTRKTRNILNPKAGEWDIPVNTPRSCDPGSELYHTM